ncbi:MAG: Mov34/MPN/PAD-1 family protein [Gemmatimonadetes bacterium]|nr:Mov34/MPN/PAD-1 family protein [Gemmatimonadota bacterium]
MKRWVEALRARRRVRVTDAPPYFSEVCILCEVERAIAREAEARVGLETGGVLIGFTDQSRNAVVVVGASGPGPRARHRRDAFNRDRAFCQAYLDAAAQRSGGRIDFVGEWHKHREPDPYPSPTDQATYRALAADPRAGLAQVVVLIAGTTPQSRPTAEDRYARTRPFVFVRTGFAPRALRILPNAAYADLTTGR